MAIIMTILLSNLSFFAATFFTKVGGLICGFYISSLGDAIALQIVTPVIAIVE